VLDASQQNQVAQALDEDAQLLSNTNLEAQLAGQPPEVQAEVIRINTEARPLALQAALLVPLLAGLLGLAVSFRMVRVGDIEPTVALEGLAFD
jgi:hypothetical protein